MVSWAHGFDFTKIIFKKVYPSLSLSPSNFLNYTNVIVEYGEYNDNSDIERSETSSGVAVHTFLDIRNEA